jgi:hypothetical protein
MSPVLATLLPRANAAACPQLAKADFASSPTNWHGRCWAITSRACAGGVIQSSGPLRYAIVDGVNVRDSRVHNYPPRWNAAPSQELLVIRRNHKNRRGVVRPAPVGSDPLLVQRCLPFPRALPPLQAMYQLPSHPTAPNNDLARPPTQSSPATRRPKETCLTYRSETNSLVI